MSFPICDLSAAEFPVGLREIPQPPQALNYRGILPPKDLTLLSIVGPRKYTSYGKQVINELVDGLKGQPIGIVSGLALGIDSLAHEAALKNGLYTLAIPGGGLSDARIYPRRHKPLAERILAAGGGLLSEFDPDFQATRWSFVQRNRLVAGISRATLLVEAAEKSGTLVTARLTADYSRDLLVVPGNIFSNNSRGVHQFLKLGAIPITGPEDLLDALDLEQTTNTPTQASLSLSPTELKIIETLTEPTHRDELIRTCGLGAAKAAETLTLLELQGHIASEQNVYRRTL